MREIKFRAWDKSNEFMIYPGDENTVFTFNNGILSVESLETVWKEGGGETYEQDEFFVVDCEIMQFTGLKDKNGKDIYEGDIVEQEKWVKVGEYAQALGVVKYKGVGFTVECVGDWVGSNADLNGNAEVIGNIYENPDLLP